MGEETSTRRRWSEEETLLALFLYFQLPFGQLHSGNPEIKRLASALGRTDNSIAMKLCNFASLDPKITETGRKGLSSTSQLDRQVYEEFGQNWSGLVARAEKIWEDKVGSISEDRSRLKEPRTEFQFEPFQGPSTTTSVITQRVGQNFFRRAVLANYEEECCITGINDPRLLSASHIKPWSRDELNRHNPANGLSLSATFDRAFDRGLITIDKMLKLHISQQLRESSNVATRSYFRRYKDLTIRQAKRFDPDPVLLEWHNDNCFVDAHSLSRR